MSERREGSGRVDRDGAWPLAPLLDVRVAAEERAAAEAARAGAAWRRACDEVRRRDLALGHARDVERGCSPAELQRAARFLRRCGDDAMAARADAEQAGDALRAAEVAYAAARARREALEAQRGAWREARSRARAAAADRELEDIAAQRAAAAQDG